MDVSALRGFVLIEISRSLIDYWWTFGSKWTTIYKWRGYCWCLTPIEGKAFIFFWYHFWSHKRDLMV